jgi:hypothetical protein
MTSMPLEPLSPDWNERVNRFQPEHLTDAEETDTTNPENRAISCDFWKLRNRGRVTYTAFRARKRVADPGHDEVFLATLGFASMVERSEVRRCVGPNARAPDRRYSQSGYSSE